MKGCPLRCAWCHNPEGLSHGIELQYFEDKCIGCRACGERSKISDADKCPADALKVCGRDIDVDSLASELLKDRTYYSNGGGVTFSGGECLLQVDFVVTVLEKIKALGITTAIDTSGFVSRDSIARTLSACDLYLYDIKCIDQQLHKKYTGVDNSVIHENLKFLLKNGKDVWIRIPVIPGFNNSIGEMSAIADFVKAQGGVKRVTLMPYHTLGKSKYKTLGIDYPFDGVKNVTESEMEEYRHLFSERNLPLY